MFKKAAAVICCLALFVSFLVVPVGAVPVTEDVYKLADYISAETYDGNIHTYIFNFITIQPRVDLYKNGSIFMTGYGPSYQGYQFARGWENFEIKWSPLRVPGSIGQEAYGGVLDIEGIGNGAPLTFHASYNIDITSTGGVFSTSAIAYLYWYKEDGSFGGLISTNPILNDFVTSGGTFTDNVDFDIFYQPPSQARYLKPMFVYKINDRTEDAANAGNMTIKWAGASFEMTCDVNSIAEQSALQEAIRDKLGDIEGELGDVNDKLDDILNQPEQEKQEAGLSGDANIDSVTGAIPDKSQGFMDAIGSLAAAMSYDGTEAKLYTPDIVIPSIPGVMDSYVLCPKQEIDFGFWFRKLPDNLLKIAQVLCTLALIGYCFKEFYGAISYAVTLKGGGKE